MSRKQRTRAWLAIRDSVIHASVVMFIVACVTVLRGLNHLDNNTASIIFGSAVGYAAGRHSNGINGRYQKYKDKDQC